MKAGAADQDPLDGAQFESEQEDRSASSDDVEIVDLGNKNDDDSNVEEGDEQGSHGADSEEESDEDRQPIHDSIL